MRKRLAVAEQVVEFGAVARDVHGVEHRAEQALDLADVLADADLRPVLSLM